MSAQYRGNRAWAALAILADAAARGDGVVAIDLYNVDHDEKGIRVRLTHPTDACLAANPAKITDDVVLEMAERMSVLWAERAQGAVGLAPRLVVPGAERACAACGSPAGAACVPTHAGERDAGDWCHPERMADRPAQVAPEVVAYARGFLRRMDGPPRADNLLGRAMAALVDVGREHARVMQELHAIRARRDVGPVWPGILPDAATGIALDRLAAVVGITRMVGAEATADLDEADIVAQETDADLRARVTAAYRDGVTDQTYMQMGALSAEDFVGGIEPGAGLSATIYISARVWDESYEPSNYVRALAEIGIQDPAALIEAVTTWAGERLGAIGRAVNVERLATYRPPRCRAHRSGSVAAAIGRDRRRAPSQDPRRAHRARPARRRGGLAACWRSNPHANLDRFRRGARGTRRGQARRRVPGFESPLKSDRACADDHSSACVFLRAPVGHDAVVRARVRSRAIDARAQREIREASAGSRPPVAAVVAGAARVVRVRRPAVGRVRVEDADRVALGVRPRSVVVRALEPHADHATAAHDRRRAEVDQSRHQGANQSA